MLSDRLSNIIKETIMNVYVLNTVTSDHELDILNSTCQVFDSFEKASKSMKRRVKSALESKPKMKVEHVGDSIVRIKLDSFVRTYTISQLLVH
ncbi:hypothetical protein [Vibrio phage vB_ValA_R15Z]|uniref:Uncharacterized protein n=1 Tax=Vibrio phage vB_ValA_R15Z TaxID=3044218 RepID=A0AA49X6S2_9CAUD|nr:hypothetical protein [Vibrio phage vB_ValA_R15Z]